MKSKPDPTAQPIVHKLRGGGVIALTTEIDAYFGRKRHDNILAACDKVRNADADFFAAHFVEGEYTANNRQKYRCYAVDRAGCVEMLKHIGGLADKKLLLLAAYDRRAEVAEKRKGQPDPEPADPREPPDRDPAPIPDEPEALEPAPLSGGPVQPFVFDDPDGQVTVRVIDLDGEPWFVAADLCRVLDIVDEKQALDRLEDDERGGCIVPTPGGPQTVRAVNEPGLYSLILTSRKPAAKRFKRWVVHEVLPQIRSTGRYEQDGVRRYGSIEDLRADPDALLSLALGYAGQIKTLSGENERLEVQLSVVEPKAAALDAMADLKGTLKLRDAAKALGFGPRFFNERLRQLDVLQYSDGRLVAYQKYVDQGWFIHKPVRLRHRDGTEYIVSQPRVTGHGLAKLAVRLGVGVQAVLGQGVLHLNRDDSQSDGEALH